MRGSRGFVSKMLVAASLALAACGSRHSLFVSVSDDSGHASADVWVIGALVWSCCDGPILRAKGRCAKTDSHGAFEFSASTAGKDFAGANSQIKRPGFHLVDFTTLMGDRLPSGCAADEGDNEISLSCVLTPCGPSAPEGVCVTEFNDASMHWCDDGFERDDYGGGLDTLP